MAQGANRLYSERLPKVKLVMRKKTYVFVLMLFTSSPGMAFASNIYKWTDEHGSVHYGDRPTIEASEEPLAVKSKPAGPSKEPERDEARAAASDPAGSSQEEQPTEVLESEEKCADHKALLRKLLTSRQFYRDDENGERVYLDEAEILAAREIVQNQVEKYCKP